MQEILLRDLSLSQNPSPKISRVRRIFDGIMQKIGVNDHTEIERALNFNDYAKHLDLKKGTSYGRMLDVGASDAEFEIFARKNNMFLNTEISSIDIDPKFVEKGKKMGASIVEMSATDLKYPDETFDTIISHASMPHCLFEERENGESDGEGNNKVTQWIAETMRVLKKGGELRFRCPAYDSDDYRGKVISDAIKVYDTSVFTLTTLSEDSHTQAVRAFVMKDAQGNILPQKSPKNITYILKKQV